MRIWTSSNCIPVFHYQIKYIFCILHFIHAFFSLYIPNNLNTARKKFNDYRAVLSETQEKELVNYILISETLCGITLTGLQQLVSQIAKKNNISGNFPSEAYNVIIKDISEDIR